MKPVSPVLPHSPQFLEITLAKDQPQYRSLPVALIDYSKYPYACRSMISSYQLTWAERLRVFLTGRVWWEQLTFGQQLQPQKMYVSEPFTEE